MSDFESYVYRPDDIEEIMLAPLLSTINGFRQMEVGGWLRAAVDIEKGVMLRKQPRLYAIGGVIISHLRSAVPVSNQPEAVEPAQLTELAPSLFDDDAALEFSRLEDFVRMGMVLGDMAAMGRYNRYASLERAYLDVGQPTLQAFQNKQPGEIDALLDTIDENSAGRTAALRDLIQYGLEFEDEHDGLTAAAITGATVAYSALTYERHMSLKKKSPPKSSG